MLRVLGLRTKASLGVKRPFAEVKHTNPFKCSASAASLIERVLSSVMRRVTDPPS
ncbi:hypothetical protein HanPSC8_Chr05g0207051 [Helianthus annuus]|nr:hypothetical protein HanPSC8_Chr05g0207051 [Helianthus annuus]